MDLASVVAALASVGVRVSGSTPNNNIQEDSSRACPTGLAGPEPSGTHNDPGQHFQVCCTQCEVWVMCLEIWIMRIAVSNVLSQYSLGGVNFTHRVRDMMFET